MKPEILAIVVTVAGFTINLLWTIHNLHVRNELSKIVADLKDDIRKECVQIRSDCVDRELCNERHTEMLRRLEDVGA